MDDIQSTAISFQACKTGLHIPSIPFRLCKAVTWFTSASGINCCTVHHLSVCWFGMVNCFVCCVSFSCPSHQEMTFAMPQFEILEFWCCILPADFTNKTIFCIISLYNLNTCTEAWF
jgi:hypothetical protein